MQQLDDLTGKKNTMGIVELLAERRAEEARQEGQEKVRMTQERSIRAFLDNTEFSIEKIASMVGVPVSFVEQVKEGLLAK